MNHRPVMQALAVVSALFGVVLLFAPNVLMDIYKAPQLNPPGVYNSMTYGGALIGIAVMNWMAASESLQAARFVIVGTLVSTTIGFFVALSRQLMEPSTPPMAWGNVVLFLVFAGLYLRLFMALRTQPAAAVTGS